MGYVEILFVYDDTRYFVHSFAQIIKVDATVFVYSITVIVYLLVEM